MMPMRLLTISLLSAWSLAAGAGEADVIDAKASCNAGVCTISATVQHADTGWEHYADAWRVLAPDGSEIGKRVLYHPHENEQPFTRSLSGVQIPAGVDHVLIEAHDKVHGYGGTQFKLVLP